jgi:hypothetical protein
VTLAPTSDVRGRTKFAYDPGNMRCPQVQQYGLGWLYVDYRRTYFHCGKCSLVNLGVPLPPK